MPRDTKKVAPARVQESVWDYPRPPRIERVERHVQVIFQGVVIAESTRPIRILETSHPPNYYIHPDDITIDHLRDAGGGTWCEWKGQAHYYDVVANGAVAGKAAWTYRAPTADFRELAGYVAFYAGKMDRCLVDGEVVIPQPGGFYGGWITPDVVGPFKGGVGTLSW